MPASASPSSTLARTDLTSTSSLAGLAVRPVVEITSAASLPQGAVSTQTTYLTPGCDRSENAVMCAGLSWGTASTRWLVANTSGSPSVPSPSTTDFIVSWSAV